MAMLSPYLKLVVRLSTSRSEGQIRTRLAPLEQTYKGRLQALLANDPQTTLVAWSYRLKVLVRPDGYGEVYPKLGLNLDTTRTREQIHNALEPIFDDLKADIRALVAGDSKTAITGWHIHRAAGCFDEGEP